MSGRHPLVEIVTSGLFLAVALRLNHLHHLPALPAYLYLIAASVSLAFIDLDVQRLPNALVLPSYPVLAILLGASAAVQHDSNALLRTAEGGACLYAFYFLLVVLYPAGMGFGDVKLAGILGGCLAYLSWQALLVGAFAGFFLGAVVGVIVIAFGLGTRKTAIPFGPFMIAGTVVAVFAAPEIMSAYAQLITHR